MKKLFFPLFLLLTFTGFSQVTIDTSTIVLINNTVVEEFRTLDPDGNQITSYRRVTKAQINEYIKKIQADNDFKKELIDRTNDEIAMYASMNKEAKERKDKLLAEIKENQRRLEAYKLMKNVLFPPK